MAFLFRRRTPEQKKKHIRGLLRAGGYFLLLTAGFSALQIRAARAEVKDRTVEIGRQMLTLANARQHDVNKLMLNGQSMYIGSSIAQDSVTAVLDRYEGLCNENRAQTAEDWKTLGQNVDAKTKEGNRVADSNGVIRGGDGDEGAVTCFTKTATSKPTVREAITTFTKTGELGALGAVRYVYAHRSAKGNTVVLTAWTDEQFNLKTFMGEPGKDALGEDFGDLPVPRPPSSQRVLSARVDQTPFGMNIYRGGDSPAEIAKLYDEKFISEGWTALDPELKPENPDDKNVPVGRLYEKDGMVLTLASKVEKGSSFTALGLAGVSGEVDPNKQTGAESKKALLSR